MSFPDPDALPPADWLAAHCGVSLRTARRWRSRGLLPLCARLVVVLLWSGDLGQVFSDWRGWRLLPDGLEYGGLRLSPAQLQGWDYLTRLNYTLQAELRASASACRPFASQDTLAALDALQAALSRARAALAPLVGDHKPVNGQTQVRAVPVYHNR